MSKVLTSLPKGERIGIAFSGGLDTSVAVAWMRESGGIPCTYTADLIGEVRDGHGGVEASGVGKNDPLGHGVLPS